MGIFKRFWNRHFKSPEQYTFEKYRDEAMRNMRLTEDAIVSPVGFSPSAYYGWPSVIIQKGQSVMQEAHRSDAAPVTPVAGYQAQSPENLRAVNINKAMEEQVLRHIDELGTTLRVDPRWLALARTQIEQGFMAMNRAVMQPQRLTDAQMQTVLTAGHR